MARVTQRDDDPARADPAGSTGTSQTSAARPRPVPRPRGDDAPPPRPRPRPAPSHASDVQHPRPSAPTPATGPGNDAVADASGSAKTSTPAEPTKAEQTHAEPTKADDAATKNERRKGRHQRDTSKRDTSKKEKKDKRAKDKSAKKADKPGKADERGKADASGENAGAGRWWRRHRSTLGKSVIFLAVVAAIVILLRIFVVQSFYIPSESMEPTLVGCKGCTDDRVLVDKVSYRFGSPQAGAIVVFHKPPDFDGPDSDLVKRVIAVGGDTVALRRGSNGKFDGNVYVNGLSLDESYLDPRCKSPVTLPLTSTTTWKVPKDDVFVMGDNRCDSEDSRAFGPIKDSSIIGRVVFIYWPFSRFGTV